jgi:hypothetical protein
VNRIALFVTVFLAAAIVGACVRGLPSRLIQGSADACVQRARELGDMELEIACQTASDLSPLLDLIAARRYGMNGCGGNDGGAD